MTDSIIEAIKSRRSVRTFDGRTIDAECMTKLENYSKECGNPYGIDVDFVFLESGIHKLSSPVISGNDIYVAGIIRKADKNGLFAFGYSFEKLLLYAQSLDISGVMLGGTFDRKAFECAVKLDKDHLMPCVSPLGYLSDKMSVRETMMRKGLKADKRKDFEEIFFEKSFDTPLKRKNAGSLEEGFDLVKIGPSAVNKQPWRIVLDNDLIHFFMRSSKGYFDIQKIDLGIALYHFDAFLSENSIKRDFLIEDPGICLPDNISYVASYRVYL